MDVEKSEGISDVRLINENVILYKELSGFQKKFHRVPESVSDNDMRYLAKIAEAEIDADLQAMFSQLRSAFKFKRRQISVDGPHDGSGTIDTPFFNYEIIVSQCETDPTKVVWQRIISAIRDPEQTFSTPFQEVFGNDFLILEVSTTEPLDLETIVDHVEDAESDEISIDYDKDVTWCSIQIAGSIASVMIKPDCIRVASRTKVPPRELLAAFMEVQQQFLSTLSCDGNPLLMDAQES